MPLILPKTLPAYAELGRENVFVMHKRRAETQQIRPLRILALNLMPTKIATETAGPPVGQQPAAGAADPAAHRQPRGDPRARRAHGGLLQDL